MSLRSSVWEYALQGFGVILGSGATAVPGVPLRVVVRACRCPSRLLSAHFLAVCSRYVLSIYNAGRGLAPLPPGGLGYGVSFFLVVPVGLYGSYRREYPSRLVVFLLSPPSAFPYDRWVGVLPVG